MKEKIEPTGQSPLVRWLSGGGEMGKLIQSTNWADTPLGPIEFWPQSLCTAISIMLASRFAMVIAWGPEFRFFYNDRYRPVLGASKHPNALGSPARTTFPEAWPFIGPLFESTRRGESVALNDELIPLDRYGYLENCYFTLSYSPIRDETGGVGGMLAVVAETTERVEGERRLKTLRDLARRGLDAKTAEEACANASIILGENPIDVPFSLFYLLDPDGTRACLVASSGLDPGIIASPMIVELTNSGSTGWPLAEVAMSHTTRVVTDLLTGVGPLPGGPYPEKTHTAVIVPLIRPGQMHPYGIIIFGVSPRRALDDRYHGFYELAADHILTAIRNALAHQEEKQRTQALAEIDRAKTTFFSNVSHEFRTPLTLMLGPIKDVLSDRTHPLAPEHRESLEVAHRNNLRLSKLVNTLLDFSRIEAGRAQALYEPIDLPVFTAELASNFRSACERAGLKLVVDCPALSEPIYVDRDMWEKIVLNLLSNAFKFTFEGEITIRLRQVDDAVEMSVRDTGTGIPPEEIPHIFSRFHRVKDARGRTHEGTGIGLALVQELVKLHGGSLRIDSVLGQGSTFTVSVKMGQTHLPTDRIGSTRTPSSTTSGADSYVEEALRWLTDQPEPEYPSSSSASGSSSPIEESPQPSDRPSILLAEDNADMRNYVQRLLGARYNIEAVSNGRMALAAVRARLPDLVLTDVMMPIMDGFELLREIRANPVTRTIPVIMLSARAGEESREEGMEAGADDYLIKPFSSRDLIARVNSHLQLARIRKQAEEEMSKANKMESIGILAGGIAHDFNNILTAIIGNLSLGKIYLDPEHRAFKRMEESQKVALRAQALTQQLLTFSVGGIPVKKTLHIGQLLTGWITFLLQGSNVQPEISIPDDLWTIEADEGQINQVINNLILNSQQAMHEGGTIHTEAANVVVGSEDLLPLSPGNYVRILVKDQGIGVPQEDLHKIFDPFFTTKPKGSGLGLTTSYWIIKRHMGHISVNSKPGMGTAITIYLPKSKEMIPATVSVPEALVPGQGKILFMDDDEPIREFAAAVLTQLGYKVDCTRDGLQAIELFQKAHESGDPFTAVILDLTVRAGMGGKDTIKRLHEIDPGVNAIVSSGYSNDPVLSDFKDYGFSARIAKPYTVESLSRILAEMIENRLLNEKIVK